MPPKKTKSKEKKNNDNKLNQNNYVVLRDLSTKVQSIVNFNKISTTKSSKLVVGDEVRYFKLDESNGRGTILLVGKLSIYF